LARRDDVHRRHTDYHAAVAGAEAGDIVSAAANRGEQVVGSGEVDSVNHVALIRAAHEKFGPLVDHSVPNCPRLLIVAVMGGDKLTVQISLELAEVRGRCRHGRAPGLAGGFLKFPQTRSKHTMTSLTTRASSSLAFRTHLSVQSSNRRANYEFRRHRRYRPDRLEDRRHSAPGRPRGRRRLAQAWE